MIGAWRSFIATSSRHRWARHVDTHCARVGTAIAHLRCAMPSGSWRGRHSIVGFAMRIEADTKPIRSRFNTPGNIGANGRPTAVS
ncbi:hypothetical protein Y048_6236 [Burkholderia pseudomallei MSHR456]|nr:hypothetical protein Y048_6236 [Burkholderia pseudomallei MSHR456]